MDYAELPLPPALAGLVAAIWTAAVPENAPQWTEFEAVPDGCVELIRRHAGRSIWRREQPALFATGLATVTAKLSLGAGARFTGVKLWPWAWHAIGGARCPGFADDWIAVEDSALAALVADDPAETRDRIVHTIAGLAPPAFARAALAEPTPGAIARRAGLSPRTLQRAFLRETGMPPRSYLRLLRFRSALAHVTGSGDSLADAAAAQGYADQAHMAREFRSLAGLPPGGARRRARGPFV